jgi:hypothetical protein
VLVTAVTILVATWVLVYIVDGIAVFGRPPFIGDRPIFVWQILFPNGAIEWVQWIALAVTAVLSAHLSGRLLERDPNGDEWKFWAIFGSGVAIMLLEDAGDMRHIIVAYALQLAGDSIGPIPTRWIFELPYLIGMVALPVYAVLRYGRVVLEPRDTRKFALAGFGLYALIGLSHGPVGRLYNGIGRGIDTVLGGGQMTLPEGRTRDSLHSALADGPLEETIELLAVACLLAMTIRFTLSFVDRKEHAPLATTAPSGDLAGQS